ncbi:MAG TPA: hypothetical protein VLB50_04345, partial [Ignavibacteriaceae bacterium]|nr:hypothetical protein [Ignavibacteriaceae bacterium]
MKTNILIMALVPLFLISSFAQPYLYYKVAFYDTSYGEQLEMIKRYDLSTNYSEEFPPNQLLSNYMVPIIDPTAAYLDVFTNKTGNTIYNCTDTTVNFEINNLSEAEIEEMLYSKQLNKLFIFSKD